MTSAAGALVLMLIVQQLTATIHVVVTADGDPVVDAQIVGARETVRTDAAGRATLQVPPGAIDVTVIKEGFAPQTVRVAISPDSEQLLEVALDAQEKFEEEITVAATRTGTHLEDQPMRVEVLTREEIEEKQLMTPGDIVMMLNEMGGLRVQATSPSLGAASIRVQGMRGRYTRFLSDGLPLFGEDVGGLGLLQIPPTDLGQVEVIKGVASALYGAGALGGVIDLLSRRPGAEPSTEALVNRTTLGGTDAVLFASRPLSQRSGATLLAGGHWQTANDVDDDGWFDLPGYLRAVVRPRLFWNDGGGRSLFTTAGATYERRHGGSVPGTILPGVGGVFTESIDTTRIDAGVVFQTLVLGKYLAALRASATRNDRDHALGGAVEQTLQTTVFAEASVRGTAPRQTWVFGAAYERSTLDAPDRGDLAYTYSVPGVFAQDDVQIAPWIAVSVSGRIDAHNVFGAFASPRASVLLRSGGWSSRTSIGGGFFAPGALTEETEAAGLRRLHVPQPLRAETGRSVSVDLTRVQGAVTLTATVFRYDVIDPVVVDRTDYVLANLGEDTRNVGAEAIAAIRRAPFSVTATYTFVDSAEGAGTARGEIPLTPRHSAGIVGMWESERAGRAGIELYYTGRQRLEDNPYRSQSAAFVLFGALVERRFGRASVFVNAEDIGNVRQSAWHPLVRQRPGGDGRWTVDAWAPLDGRVVNAGLRLSF